MSNTLQSAPPAVAPKQMNDFVFLPAFPVDGAQVLTVISHNYIPEYKNPFAEEEKPACPAVEFYLGADTEAGIGLIKTFPITYSLHEKATYPKLYKMATGKECVAGSSPDDMNGHGLTGTITNVAKTSKKGKAYTASKVGEFAAVHPKLKGEIAPLAKLKPLLAAALTAKVEKDDGNVPY